MENHYTLITGASSGIGEGFARSLAAKGTPLILVARRLDRLEKLQDELQKSVSVKVIQADLNDVTSCETIFHQCQSEGWNVGGLINNAGLGVSKNIAETEPDRLSQMINVNLHSLTLLTRFFLPAMIVRGEGQVLNVASVAGFAPLSHFAVYAATKSYVISLSEALAMEVRRTKIKVSCLCPGPVAETEFFDHGEVQQHFSVTAQSVDQVVTAGLLALEHGNVICFPSLSYKISIVMARFFPRWWVRLCAAEAMERSLRDEYSTVRVPVETDSQFQKIPD